MKTLHAGMRLDEEDWKRGMALLTATLDAFEVPEQEKGEVMSFHKNISQTSSKHRSGQLVDLTLGDLAV
jgi:hypothetical protein